MKKIILTVFAALLFMGAQAQSGNGTIRVNVVDDQTGEALIGANVVITGTTQGSVTDLDGSASIPSLKPGDYSIQVSFVSYQTKTIEGVHVDAGQVQKLNVRLAQESLGLKEVVVTAKALRNSESALLTIQKKSPKVLDAISADQFSKNGDGDAAAAVKRVTGVTVESGKYVYVRGLGDRYSKSVLNGSDIPGLDPNRNSVQMDLFPTNLIDNIIVYKTFTPDLPGDFSGGLVDINTKDFPDRYSLQFGVGVGYNAQSNLNKHFLTSKGGGTDFLAYDDGSRSLPNELKQYDNKTFPRPYEQPYENLTKASRAFKNNQFDPTEQIQPLDYNLNFSVGNQTQFLGKQLGFILGLTYSRQYMNYENGVQNLFKSASGGQTELDNDVLSAFKEHKSQSEVLYGGLLNTSYKLNGKNKLGVILMANRSATSSAYYQVGYDFIQTSDSSNQAQNRGISWEQRALNTGQLRGEHQLNILNGANIKWTGAYTSTENSQPDFRLIRNGMKVNNNGEDTTYNFGNQSRPSRYFRKLNQQNASAKVDLSIPVSFLGQDDGKLKFGGAYGYKTRDYREDIYTYSLSSFGDFQMTGDISEFFQEDRLGYNSSNTLSGQNYLELQYVGDNNYKADQKLYAGYGMIETSIVDNLKLTTGLRFEKTYIHVRTISDKEGTINTNDFLPSFALTYSLNDKMNIRGSASRTLARPTFREFSPVATFDYFGGYIQNGNPDLKRTLINNFDLRIERYGKPGEYFSFSLFYKDFIDPIENAQDPKAGGSTVEFRYRNVDEAKVYGAELELRKNLGDWVDFLNHFKVSTNMTYVHSYVSITNDEYLALKNWLPNPSRDREMYNQSPYVINANLTYDNVDNGWASTLGFNVMGKRLKVFNLSLPSIYLQPRPELNFSIKKKVSTNLSVGFRAKNILNPAYNESLSIGDVTYSTTKYKTGRDFSLSLTYLMR